MKRLLIFAAICIAAVSCSKTFKVDGTVTYPCTPNDSAYIVVTNINNQTNDTLSIIDGKFSFEAPASDTTGYRFSLIVPSVRPDNPICSAVCFGEKGIAVIEMGETEKILACGKISSALNELLDTKYAMLKDYKANIRAAYDSLESNPQGLNDAITIYGQKMSADLRELLTRYLKENKDNMVGAEAISSLQDYRIYLPLDEYEALTADAASFVMEHPVVKDYTERIKMIDKCSEGKMFIDFEGKTPEGEITKLSDFVGHGNYVLLDFWASWCGPCMSEIPKIKNLYDKYKEKGFVVVGAAVWDIDDTTYPNNIQAIKDLGMDWPQIFTGKDMSCTDKYNADGIPLIVIFNPDGTIYKRNIRGDDMISIISALYE